MWVAQPTAASTGSSTSPAKKMKGEKDKENNNSNKTGNPPHYKVMMRQVVKDAREIAMLKAITCRVFLIPTTSPIVVAAENAGKGYHEAVQGKKDHGQGQPHAHVFMAMIMAIVPLLTDPNLKQQAEAMVKSLDSPLKVETIIQVAQVKKTYSDDTRKIIWNPTTANSLFTGILAEAILREGGTEKHGTAPRTPDERKLNAYLNKDAKDAKKEMEEE